MKLIINSWKGKMKKITFSAKLFLHRHLCWSIARKSNFIRIYLVPKFLDWCRFVMAFLVKSSKLWCYSKILITMVWFIGVKDCWYLFTWKWFIYRFKDVLSWHLQWNITCKHMHMHINCYIWYTLSLCICISHTHKINS